MKIKFGPIHSREDKESAAIFSMNSSFVSFNNSTHHMINKVRFQDGHFYVPVNSFAHFCKQLNLKSVIVDLNRQIATINPYSNVSHYTIDETDEHYIIKIFSDIDFSINKPIIELLDSGLDPGLNQVGVSIRQGVIDNGNESIWAINYVLEETKQEERGLLLLFNLSYLGGAYTPVSISNYSHSIKSDVLEIVITKSTASQYAYNRADWDIKTIIIDPGHGGKDPGAIGYHNIKEKHIVLDIAKELGDLINEKMSNMEVIYTREDDTFLGLKNRTSIANKNNGHIFISIHANSSSAKSARGYEIYLLQPNSVNEAIDVAIRENASIAFEEDKTQYNENQMIATLAQNTFLKESEKLAVFIQEALKKELPKTRNRGIKQAGFHVLVGASMPNLLIEVGFLTNKSEAQLLNKAYYREQIAKAIFQGIQEYVEAHNY